VALKARLPKLDGLSEAIKAEYREVDGAFVLDVEPVDGYALEDINGLKSTLGKQKTEINTLKTKVAEFADLDPAAAKDALNKLKEFGGLSPEELAKAKVKTALDQQQAQFNTTIQQKDNELKSMTAQLEAVMIDQQATAALAAKGGNVKLLLPHLKSNVKMVKTDKGFATQVVDAEGNPRIHVANGRTSDMTLEQFVEEMATSTDFAAAFQSTAKPGTGSKTTNGKSNGDARPKVIDISDTAMVNASLEDIAKGTVTVAGL